MTPDASRFGGAALPDYQGYRYTVVTIINGAQPHTAEGELWSQRLSEIDGKWRYFRRHVAGSGLEAARQVEADFKQWVDGQLEAADPRE